ncbi:MAG TPA: hypothetical protein VIM10_07260 [Actinopolymorphaceae bacterium]
MTQPKNLPDGIAIRPGSDTLASSSMTTTGPVGSSGERNREPGREIVGGGAGADRPRLHGCGLLQRVLVGPVECVAAGLAVFCHRVSV